MGEPGSGQRRAGDPRGRPRPGGPLPAVCGAPCGPGASVPRGGRADPGAVDRKEGHLSRQLLPGRGRGHGVEAAAAPASADLDGRRASRCAAPRGVARGWLDGLGRVERCRVRPVGADTEGGAGEGRARSRQIPDLQACLHGGGRAPGGGARRARSLVHRGVPQPGRYRRVRRPRHAGAGARAAGGTDRNGRQPPAAEP